MDALAEELRRGEGLLLADEQPPEAVTAKAAFAASVRAFLAQQARRPGAPWPCGACVVGCNLMRHVQQISDMALHLQFKGMPKSDATSRVSCCIHAPKCT